MTLAPVMLSADRHSWRTLVAIARRAADKPEVKSTAAAFRIAADGAFKAVFPDQAAATQKTCGALIGFGRAWPAMLVTDRQDNAAAVRLQAARVAALIGDETPPAEPPPACAQRLPYRDDTFDEDAA